MIISLLLLAFPAAANSSEPSLVEILGEGFEYESEFDWNAYPILFQSEFSKSIRTVSHAARPYAGWISTFSTSVSLGDLDGDGLENDLCLVDPRTDLVNVMPVPLAGKKERYKPFVLDLESQSFYPGFMKPFGCLPHDMNRDGALDLLVYFAGRPPLAFFQTDKLEFQSSEILPEFSEMWLGWVNSSAVFADINGDGMDDLILGGYIRDLFEFWDPEASEFLPLPDSAGLGLNGGVNRILLGKKDPTSDFQVCFERMRIYEEEHGFHGWTTGVLAGDLNGDGLPEIFFSNMYGVDHLWVNQSTRQKVRFTPAPMNQNLAGMRTFFRANGAVMEDVDLDGKLDLAIANEGIYHLLDGEVVPDHPPLDSSAPDFSNSPLDVYGFEHGGWGWDLKTGDMDGDGYPEWIEAGSLHLNWPSRLKGSKRLFLSDVHFQGEMPWLYGASPLDLLNTRLTNNSFLKRTLSGLYQNLGKSTPLGEIHNLRALSLGDVDGDGDLDILGSAQWYDAYVLINETRQLGAHLSLKIQRTVKNTAGEIEVIEGSLNLESGVGATGTQVLIRDFLDRRQLKEVFAGNGHGGHSATHLLFGLGLPEAGKKVSATFRWRDFKGNLHQKSIDLEPGIYTIALGA